MKLREEKKTLKKINKKNLHLHFVPNQPKERNVKKEKKIPLKKEEQQTTQLLFRSTPYQPRNNYKYRNKGIKATFQMQS